MSNTLTFHAKCHYAVFFLSIFLSEGVLDLFLIPSKNPEEAQEVYKSFSKFFPVCKIM